MKWTEQGVHREKMELESKLQEAENEQANDKQIQSLEKDRDWYRAQKNELEGYGAWVNEPPPTARTSDVVAH